MTIDGTPPRSRRDQAPSGRPSWSARFRQTAAMRAAVVGHVEWVQFLGVDRMPTAGEIVHATDAWEIPAGGGPGAAVQMAKLAGGARLFTAVGDDDLGRRSVDELVDLGLEVHAAVRDTDTRRAITHVDRRGERTITVIGDRLAPHGTHDLPWHELARHDAVYLTAGDVDAVRAARRARVLVATARVLPLLADAGVELDALVGSDADPAEAYDEGELDPPPRIVVRTRGAEGGTLAVGGRDPSTFPPAPLPGPVVDAYGAGDAFAGALAYALGIGSSPSEAVALASRCAAAVLTGRGPYEGQLTAADL